MKECVLMVLPDRRRFVGTFDVTNWRDWWLSDILPAKVLEIREFKQVYAQYTIAVTRNSDGHYSIFWSDDYGIHWTEVLDTAETILDVEIIDVGYAMMATSGGIYTSTDTGLTWTKVNASMTNCISLKEVDANLIYAIMEYPVLTVTRKTASYNAIYLSEDFGVTWIPCGIGRYSPSLENGWRTSRGCIDGYGGAYHVLVKNKRYNDLEIRTALNSISYPEERLYFDGHRYITSMKSTFPDSDGPWTPLGMRLVKTSGVDPWNAWYAIAAVRPDNLGRLAIVRIYRDPTYHNAQVVAKQDFYHYQARGTTLESYEVISVGTTSSIRFACINTSKASGSSIIPAVWYSTDGGVTWQEMPIDNPDLHIYVGDPTQSTTYSVYNPFVDDICVRWKTNHPTCINGWTSVRGESYVQRNISYDMDFTTNVPEKTKTYSMDVKSILAKTKTHTMDTVLMVPRSKTNTMDAVILKTSDVGIPHRMKVKKVFELGYDEDIHVALPTDLTYDMDSFTKAIKDSYYYGDLLIKTLDLEQTYDMDVVIIRSFYDEIMTDTEKYMPQMFDICGKQQRYDVYDARFKPDGEL